MRVLEKEAEHLLRGIGSSRIGVGAGGAAARPTMASSVNDPLPEDRSPACVRERTLRRARARATLWK